MELFIGILSGLAILYGLVLFFAPGKGAFIAALVSIFSGIIAFDEGSFFPLIVGFVILWILRLMGLENR
jgi:hypothetical protein